jgi:hypothetical protein
VLKVVTSVFGKLAAIEARLKGEYRKGLGTVEKTARKLTA